MSSPSSRQNLIDYCLRKLGFPVLEINIDDDQLEDRIDEAFQFYREFHYDAVELVYLKAQVTPSRIRITGINAANFANTETIVGATSGATAIVYSNISGNQFQVYQVTGTFVPNETITGRNTNTTATLSSITLGSYDNKYFEISDAVTGVNKVLQLSNSSNSIGMFDVRYQLMLNNIQSLTNTDIIYYTQLKTHLNLLNDLMTGQKPMQYNRHMNRLYVDLDWKLDVLINNYIIVECYRILDPDTFTDVYNDYFLKRYATALIKQQWGINMKKFEGVQLPGGVTLNGQKIYDEATEELQQLRDEAERTFQLPVDFFTG
jgi:hypothetical protein